MAYVYFNTALNVFREMEVEWQCLNEKCGVVFRAAVGTSCRESSVDWVWCKCGSSSKMICEATEG